ncbi:hypothetical protein BR93DRAFT_804432 [Coniochaeta sp. PMI_546]|nr:hypothetical protein BR93DRAFT_804432 [Coniochaeta sp. PMI_546]
MDPYGFRVAPLHGNAQQLHHTPSIDAHAQQHFHHGDHIPLINDEQQQQHQQQHLQYGQVQFRADAFSAEHVPANGIAPLSHHDGYHNIHDYGQGHTHSLHASPHVNRYHNLHHLSSSPSSPHTFFSFRHPSLSGLTMTYGDTGSDFGAPPATESHSSPQLRPKDAGGDVPTAPSLDQVRYDQPVDQVVRQDEGEEADQGVMPDDGSPAAGIEAQSKRGPIKRAPSYVVDPPNLVEWRQRLFDLEEMVVMTNTEPSPSHTTRFETYFPHIDNVYSHRSTQQYKRKPFVSYYWDCRLKGRPPGTPKSTDPNKKKRKRQGRGLGLCDVKIKIVEYTAPPPSTTGGATKDLPEEVLSVFRDAQEDGGKVWTIQRVCGFGPVERKAVDGAIGSARPASHRHTLEKSDDIKKNSVLRWVAAQEKEVRKATAVARPAGHQATGLAAVTVRKRSREADLKLYASCYCPFSQQVWIGLEAKGLAYQYCETDPFRAQEPTHMLGVSPTGTVPTIALAGWQCSETASILEYLEELDSNIRLHPSNPQHKADCRTWIAFINSEMVPAFYALLAANEEAAQNAAIEQLQRDVTSLVQAADKTGPYFLGDQMCLVDIHLAPFLLRMSRMLQPTRGWAPSVPEPRWQAWVAAIESNVHVRSTVSADTLYAETLDLLIKVGQVRIGWKPSCSCMAKELDVRYQR